MTPKKELISGADIDARRETLFCWRCAGSTEHDHIAYVRDTNPDDCMAGMMTRARCMVCFAWKATTD